MVLSYCNKCEHHEILEIEGREQSRCQKENCLSIYTNCLMKEAIQYFISRNEAEKKMRSQPALELCYGQLK
jgi:hypothetical protein